MAMRVHGDFHLERVLITENDVLIIDPGVGEAARPAVQRGRAVPPPADLGAQDEKTLQGGRKILV